MPPMRIHFCGVRGSTSAAGIDFVRYGGHTSCLALAHDGAGEPTLMLDAGTGLQAATRLFAGEPFDGTILLTPLHRDPVPALPFFAAADNLAARVEVLLPEQESGASAENVLAGFMSPPYFPVEAGELRGRGSSARI